MEARALYIRSKFVTQTIATSNKPKLVLMYKLYIYSTYFLHVLLWFQIKLSFFKNNVEKAYVVFNAQGKTKTTWFKCNNILYSSYPDLPDTTLTEECPGRSEALTL